ncbi:MAG TPA: Lrp/AsnC family transcriptional regulator [Proteobacteria bacterium]|nr:Lrp/AsnC family transcriptional regulator [Pseudomonadota bacterium]
MDERDRAILNEIQSHFPIESRPYATIGERLQLTETEVLDRIRRLQDRGIIRRLGANFDSRRLGYMTTLCGAKVPPERLEEFVRVVNSYQGVTHNYLRRHAFNVWFTFIAESEEAIERQLKEITEKTGVKVYNFPAIRLFKIKAEFKV